MKTSFIVFSIVLLFATPAQAQFDMQQIAVIQGARDSLGLGASLAGIGDVNKDGFEDLAAGQNAWNNGDKKTFIFFWLKEF